MKIIKIISLILFAAVIIVPLAFFNTETDAISLIDNRKLAENPFTAKGDITQNIQNYVNDRIGFRDEMITAYTVLNDKLFHKMVHPSYSYGKDGFVFGAGMSTSKKSTDFVVAFADMVAEIQEYCTARNVPFLFVFNPAKPAVYQDKIADGINYNREWVDLFLAELEKRNVNYLDNTATLTKLRENGVDGFNQKYDANHWNDMGAFYGTQAMLEQLSQNCDNIHVNKLEEFSQTEELKTSLLASKFPIEEYVPKLGSKASVTVRNKDYLGELERHPSYQGFGYYVNHSEDVKDTPKVLVFQGSYMNSYGNKFLMNAFSEYIHVHDYQNVLDFPYYFNIFQPECVIFEVAEYTFTNQYFDYQKMKGLNYNPPLSALEETMYTCQDIAIEDLVVEKGETLTKITWQTEQTYPYVWMTLDNTYDMRKVEGGYQITIETQRYEAAADLLKIYSAIS
ncbi:MAG: hypothetical protein J6Q30_03220 [Oscillospiraceae bacterium]|nr:hypothetical protein [Oscillospiraceae bacterium]